MKRKNEVRLCICLLLILALLCGCSRKPAELKKFNATRITIYLDYDEAAIQDNKYVYRFDLLERTTNSTLKGQCEFSYFFSKDAEPTSYEWSEDPDGTKHLHQTSGSNSASGYISDKYDVSVFENVLKLIENGASIYTGPGSDNQGKIVYKKLPLLIEVVGFEENGVSKTIYIDEVNSINKLVDTIEQLKGTNQ